MVLIVISVVASVVVGSSHVAAQENSDNSSDNPRVERLLLDGRDLNGRIVATSPALDTVQLTSAEYDDAAERLSTANGDLIEANGRSVTSVQEQTVQAAQRGALSTLIRRDLKRVRKVERIREEQQRALKAVAVHRYVTSASTDVVPSPTATADEQFEVYQRSRMLTEAELIVRVHLETIEYDLAQRQSTWEQHVADLRSTERRLVELRTAIDNAERDAVDATERIVEAESDIVDARPYADVAGSDLSMMALDAYWRAALALSEESPSCGLRWWALAGIGRTESIHGRVFGAEVLPDGTLSEPIYGIALDGTNNTKVIVDSDGGRIDADPLIDRAVGPMQFIPTTWKRFAADQTGDGVADPQNLYDASLASARYLCRQGPGLDTDAGLRRAFYSYNNSESYVELVLSRAHGYETLEVPGPDPG